MNDTNQQTPLPTLQPGDSHMESLIEAAIQGHASTREAMRWLVRQIVPQPAQATQADVTDAALIRALVDHIERNTCTHEETHRGGAIWEVCDSCGARWADDEGGKPEFKWPAVVEKARAILALRPAATFCGYCGGNDEDPVDHCMDCTRPAAVPMTIAHPMQPIVIAEDGRIRFKKNQIVDDLYELRKVHKLDLNEMACRNYSQEDRNQFAQLIGYSVDGWGTLSYATGVEKADAIAEALTAQAKKEGG